ncbi:DEAD/DEAH box helicase [Anaerobacillus sp. MEB173]|uniref:DEAD/DEAH box helicase n=1 Tax=Anaerobacillus sp. MEB173 TaxID=3383345 RepID=UPI003F8FBB5A
MKQSNFARFNLQSFLIDAIEEQGFLLPTEIQERLIPAIRNGVDAIGQSQTGSGKTLAFLLPIVDQIEAGRDEVQAVITAPTRELASQIYTELQKLLEFCSEDEVITAKLLVGGTDRVRTMDKLKNQPHIVVGTPGRIYDMVNSQALKVYTATKLVVDEADQMLDMGFIADVDKIAARMAEQIQMLVFSATIPEKLQPFLRKYMNNPRHVQVKPKDVTAATIDHVLIPLRHRDKHKLLIDVARLYNPFLAIIFTNTKEKADEVADAMVAAGLNVERLHGDLNPRQRKQVMRQLQDAKIQYLVATDLAARGIDIKGISHIINYEIPKDLDFYIHRVGRSARAGESGIAATIYEPSDDQAIAKLTKRGISFSLKDIRQGDWVSLDRKTVKKEEEQEQRKTPQKNEQQERTGGKAKAKQRAVKPGYKKKAKWAKEKQAKRERKLKKRK